MPVKHMSASKRFKRASSLVRIGSYVNAYSLSATRSSEAFEGEADNAVGLNVVQKDSNKKIVHEVIDNIFDDKNGFFDISSSACSSVRGNSSDYSFDKRLQYWRNALVERRQIAQSIREKIGKKPCEMLFNRLTTVDNRDTQTVKRVLDYADRLNSIKLMSKPEMRLPEYVDPYTCVTINELRETWPKPEREGYVEMEISGLPKIAKEEQLGRLAEQGAEKKNHWLKSKVLEQHIEDHREDIERVVQYYPDIENLQVVGESLHKTFALKHNSQIKLLREEAIYHVSSDTSLCDEAARLKAQEEAVKQAAEPPEYGIKINDQVFIMSLKRSSKTVEVTVPFVCEPFDRLDKRVLRLENIGRKVLNFQWTHRSYFLKTSQLLKANDQEFLFDHRPFRLIGNEVRDVVVRYQPRKVDIVKERWILKIDPQFFCRKMDGLVLKFHGWCRPSTEYVQKLDEIESAVIDKSNLRAVTSLTTGLAAVATLIQPDEVICPYRRKLKEHELFESLNDGYKCIRLHDLQLLKDIYKSVKKPREKDWDLRLDTLKTLIMRHSSVERRALMFSEMTNVLQNMRGRPDELEAKEVDTTQRDQTRLVYVRGTISTGIGEWQELVATAEEAFLKPEIREYYEALLAGEEEEGGEEDDVEEASSVLVVDESVMRLKLLKKIKRRKAFRDTIYMQTYTHLCNVIEDVVSVIESTEIV